MFLRLAGTDNMNLPFKRPKLQAQPPNPALAPGSVFAPNALCKGGGWRGAVQTPAQPMRAARLPGSLLLSRDAEPGI